MRTHIPVSPIYSRGRVAQQFNDNSPEINSLRERLVTLEVQVRQKDHQIRDLQYHRRCAKRQNKFDIARVINRDLVDQKQQFKTLKNQRNCLFNRLTKKRAFTSRQSTSKVCSKTLRLRAFRLAHEALFAT